MSSSFPPLPTLTVNWENLSPKYEVCAEIEHRWTTDKYSSAVFVVNDAQGNAHAVILHRPQDREQIKQISFARCSHMGCRIRVPTLGLICKNH